MRAYLERATVWAALWWVVFGLEFGAWRGWENPAYAIPLGLVCAFVEFRLGRPALQALRRRSAKPS
jgi:hypothetical protein